MGSHWRARFVGGPLDGECHESLAAMVPARIGEPRAGMMHWYDIKDYAEGATELRAVYAESEAIKLEDMDFCVVCGEPCEPGDPPVHEGDCRKEWWRAEHPEDGVNQEANPDA